MDPASPSPSRSGLSVSWPELVSGCSHPKPPSPLPGEGPLGSLESMDSADIWCHGRDWGDARASYQPRGSSMDSRGPRPPAWTLNF